MATTITAGNATNGAAVSSDNTGILELKTGTGSGTTALTLSTAQAATFAGAVTASGLVTGATGALYPLVSGTAITLTNQTAPDFTGIPSWVKRITVMFNGVSTNGTGIPLIQLGDAGGYETTGYVSSSLSSGAATPTVANSTSAFILQGGTWAASNQLNGAFILTLLGSNTWTAVFNLGRESGVSTCTFGSGVKTLSDTLTSVRLYIDGTQQFDAGTINILYE